MSTTRSYSNPFEVVDYTEGMQNIPNVPTLMSDLGLWSSEFHTGRTVTFEQKDNVLNLIGDRHRGEKPQTLETGERRIRSYPIAHFPWTDTVWPSDVQGKRAYNTKDTVETIAGVMADKAVAASNAMDLTLEIGRMSTLVTGNIYAPNNTIAGNFYTDFGVVRKDINFDLLTPTTEVMAKGEDAIAHIQDTAEVGHLITNMIVLCSPKFFSALIVHPTIKTAYQFYRDGNQQPLRDRLGGMGRRTFVYGGLTYIECRERGIDKQLLIPDGEARIVPQGLTDAFKTYFGPAETIDLVNSIAMPKYLWSTKDAKGRFWDLDGETNFINVMRRPGLVIRATMS